MEQVVLVDSSGAAVGSAPKCEVHTSRTPLHLAFSCYVLDLSGRVLVTRRALSKLTWPGVWTNSFCGHPEPGELLEDAVHRRAQHELGMRLVDLRLVDAEFRYRATDDTGVVENELCPVFVARTGCEELVPNPDEVGAFVWSEVAALVGAAEAAPYAFSPWLRLQLPLVRDALGGAR